MGMSAVSLGEAEAEVSRIGEAARRTVFQGTGLAWKDKSGSCYHLE